jgi:hypothetical protein
MRDKERFGTQKGISFVYSPKKAITMADSYKKLFSALEAPEPPANLTEKILLRISRRAWRILGMKIAASAVVFGVSVGVAVAGCMDLVSNLSGSGFFQLAGLIFSDFSAITANFPDFALSMVETFPVFTAAIFLSGAMFAIWSMAALIDEASLMRVRHEQSFGV